MTSRRRIDWKRVDPPCRAALFVNPSSGRGAGRRVAAQAEARGIHVVELGRDRTLADEVAAAIGGGADALAVAGGDGSLAPVAQAAVDHDLPFACVPAGTRNHFARDLGLDPDDPVAALDALGDGVEGRIDTGEVNGRLFLNNVSLGIYAEAVRRADYRDAKLRTLVETAHAVLGPGGDAPGLQLADDRGVNRVDPAIVLVSNNPYALTGPRSRGARPTLRGGRLGVIVIDRPDPGRAPSGRAWSAPTLRIDAPQTVHAGADGEAVELAPPLELASRPAALRVRAPRRVTAAGSAPGRRRPAVRTRSR